MGYQERRIWILFGVEAVFYGVYFGVLHYRHIHLGITLHLVLALIVVQVALEVLLAATSDPERRDERDRAIESRGYRVGYLVLLAGLAYTIAAVAHQFGFTAQLTASAVINTLLLAAGVAELAKLLTQIVQYRRTA